MPRSIPEALRRFHWTRRIERHKDAPLAEKLRWWPRGFRVQSARLYGFPATDPAEYVPDFIVSYRHDRFNPVEALFKHKVVRRAMLLATGAAQLETVAVIWRGRVVLQPFSAEHRTVSPGELERWLIADGGDLVIKPESDERGQGVALIRSENGRLLRRYGTGERPFAIEEYADRLTMVERRAEQAPFWRAFFPGTVNTIRLLTIWPRDARPFLAAATQKIGTSTSVPADNFARGGLAAAIDVETGRMSAARMRQDVRQRIPRHPETGALIEGVVLPDWPDLAADILRIASGFPGDCFVGWDVFRDPAGRTVVIEANGGTASVQIMQLEGGLLRDPRVRAFYREIGVL
jgi:hypothetical protein